MERVVLGLASVYGFLAVALGAFGAHGLRTFLASLEDGPQRLAWWQTAAQYHLAHALALGVVAFVAGRSEGNAAWIAAAAFSVGVLLFSGSLYVMTITGTRWLGAITPLGGVLLLVGWVSLGIAAFHLP